jgi:hypothetical protein
MLLLPAVTWSWAALIKGTVSDTLTTARVESVLVAMQGSGIQTYTDASGVFSLNIPSAIRPQENRPLTPAVAWTSLQDAVITVYGANGVLVQSVRGGTETGVLTGLPDGMYLAEARKDGRTYVGKMLKTSGLCQAGGFVGTTAKTTATVTLVFTHKYYTTEAAAAAEGDTNVTIKLTMWFPDSATTGPTGTLTPSAALTVRDSGALIQNLDISGGITIKAKNITIRNCRFGSLNISIYDSFYTGIVVEDCKLDWAGVRNFALRRCELSSASDDLIRVGGVNVIIEDCYLHVDGPEVAGTHCDIIQEYPVGTGANCLVRHNTLFIAIMQNSCVFSCSDVLVDRNLLAGAGYTIYANAGYRIINNHFSTRFYPSCGYWGVMTGTPGTCAGNVWHETGAPINCP